MPRRLYRKALAVLALAACLWALPATAEAPAAQTAETAARGESSGQAAGVPAMTGGAVLVGAGAYSFVRKQRQEERDRRRAEQKTPVYFENHTQTGTLRPEERDRIE